MEALGAEQVRMFHSPHSGQLPFPSIAWTKSPWYVLLFNFSSKLKLLMLTISSTSERSSLSAYRLLPMDRWKIKQNKPALDKILGKEGGKGGRKSSYRAGQLDEISSGGNH